MVPYSSQSRDAGLRKLTLMKRWLIAGSVALTGIFTAIAANAFPGKTAKPAAAQPLSAGQSREASEASASASATQGSEGSSNSLSAPSQSPRAAEATESTQVEKGESNQTATEAPVVSGGS